MRKGLPNASDRLAGDMDAFGHRDYAEALAETLWEAEPPYTLGLFGVWGVGKTTILREAEAQFRDRYGDSVFVSFSAWRSEAGSFRREFLVSVHRQLIAAGAFRRRRRVALSDLYTTSTRSTERFGMSGWRLLQAAVAVVGLFVIAYLAGVRGFGELFDRSDVKTPVAAVIGMSALIVFVLTRVADVFQPRTGSVTALRLEEPERFVERFASLMGGVKRSRVIIAVDDVDRMSAEEAVEVLRTIKTFLEPVAPQTQRKRSAPDVVFLVAADRAVLRAHFAKSFGDDTPVSGVARTADQLADDYLAKYFSASLTVRPVLHDDMHAYVRKHVSRFLRTINQPPSVDDDIVRLCVAGLRHNPRHVEQFVRTMEIRWRLVESREGSRDEDHADSRPLSSDPATIVKLALIEDEWPLAFERIHERPGRLAAWTALAAAGSAPDAGDWSGEDWERFASFLRTSADVAPTSLRPFLRLRRSVVEGTLPRYDDFHEAATSPGSSEAVARFVEEQDYELMARYAARMPDIMREALKAGDLDGTVHCLEAALTVHDLTGQPFEFYDILRAAVAEPELKTTLQRVSPTPLVYSARIMGGDVQTKVEVALANHIIETAARGEPPSAAAQALAGGPYTTLSPQAREKLASAFSQEPLINSFAHYLPLLGSPIGFPDGIARRALDAVTSPGPPPVLRRAGSAFDVLVEALLDHEFAQSEQVEILKHCETVLASADGDDELIEQHLEDIARVAGQCYLATEEAALRLVNHVSAAARQVPRAWLVALEIVVGLSRGHEREDVSPYITHAQAFLPGGESVVSERQTPDNPPSFFDPWGPTIGAVAAAAEAREEHVNVARLLRRYGSSSGVGEALAERYLARLEGGSEDPVENANFAETMGSLPKSESKRLLPLIPGWLVVARSSVYFGSFDVMLATAWTVLGADDLTELLAGMLEDPSSPPPGGLVAAVIDRLAEVGDASRARLAAMLAADSAVAASPDSLSELASRLAPDNIEPTKDD